MSPDTLRTLRILAGLTQLGLAASLGVHRTTVARWETGKLPIPRWVELAIVVQLLAHRAHQRKDWMNARVFARPDDSLGEAWEDVYRRMEDLIRRLEARNEQ